MRDRAPLPAPLRQRFAGGRPLQDESPLRGEEDRAALLEGLLDGTIDMIATDHAPHTREEKGRGLEKSLMGVVGLETAFAALYTHLVRPGLVPLARLVELFHDGPARRFGLGRPLAVGEPADLSVFDLETACAVDPETFQSMGRATPSRVWSCTACAG